jgi:hypothetical protein
MCPMATYKRSRAQTLIENILCSIIAIMIGIVLFIGFIHLPDFFDWRDGYHEGRTIYGLRG